MMQNLTYVCVLVRMCISGALASDGHLCCSKSLRLVKCTLVAGCDPALSIKLSLSHSSISECISSGSGPTQTRI